MASHGAVHPQQPAHRGRRVGHGVALRRGVEVAEDVAVVDDVDSPPYCWITASSSAAVMPGLELGHDLAVGADHVGLGHPGHPEASAVEPSSSRMGQVAPAAP